MAKLKILMVPLRSLSFETGGINTMVRTLADGLGERHDVQVLINDWDQRRLTTQTEAGLVTHHLRLRTPFLAAYPVRNFLGWLRDFPVSLWQLRRLMRTQRYDVVHLHFAAPFHSYFRILRLFDGPPYLVTLHGSDTARFPDLPWHDRKLTTWALGGAARIVAVSESLRDKAQRTFGVRQNIDCIHNGVRAGSSFPERQVPSLDPLLESNIQKFFLVVANVTHVKGHDVAIRAWARVQAVHRDVHLVMVGDRRDAWNSCEELIEQLGCGETVHMLGPVAHAVVCQLMSRAMGLVAPSRSEGLPMVLLEAGCAGLPVICSQIGPFLEVVETDQTALTVPVDDPEALAEAIIRLASSLELRRRLGRALKRRVETEFSADRMVERYERLYYQALEGHEGNKR